MSDSHWHKGKQVFWLGHTDSQGRVIGDPVAVATAISEPWAEHIAATLNVVTR